MTRYEPSGGVAGGSGASRSGRLWGWAAMLAVVVAAGAMIGYLAGRTDHDRSDIAGTGPASVADGAEVLAPGVVRVTGDGPIITEVMSSNGRVLVDEDGDHSDWIELHNPTDDVIDLEGYHLSDDDDEPDRWQLPQVALDPGGYLVVFASGKDRAPDGGDELHTDFRLEQDGEAVLLVEPDGRRIADRFEASYIPRDASLGRDPGDLDRLCFFAVPTPGEANAPECFDDTGLGAPQLSADSGFYGSAFELTISSSHPDARIIYTLDGSYPDLDTNPGRTLVYDGPLRIDDRTPEPDVLATIDTTVPSDQVGDWALDPPDVAGPVHKGTVVRARTAYSAERVATYFVGDHLVRAQLPVVSLTIDPDHLFDHDTGIYVAGRVFEEYRDSDAFDPDGNWNRTPRNYTQSGRAWERPPVDDLRSSAVLELCAPGGVCGVQRPVGIRIHGNHSRIYPQKSLRLYARNDYGARTFDHPFFGADAPSDHRRLLLRNSGQDRALLLVDGYLHDLMGGHLDADTQAYQPVVLFINGEYWGIHNLRERYDRHYLEAVHGADPDQVVILDRFHEVSAGDPHGDVPLRELLAFVADADPSDPATLARVEAEIDLDNFLDHVIAHVFVGNRDWPHTNVRAWREPDGPHEPGAGVRDGRWRWFVFDLDHLGQRAGLYRVDYDPFEDRLEPSDDPEHYDGYPMLIARLMDNEQVRHRFLSRFADHLNTTFRSERTLAELDELARLLEPEIAHHEARWGRADERSWHGHLAELRAFMAARPDVQRAQLTRRFSLGGWGTLEVATADPDAGTVRVNTVDVAAGTPGVDDPSAWHGQYPSDVPVRLEAVPAAGSRFARWEGLPAGSGAATSPVVEVVVGDGASVEAVFERG